MAPETVRMVLVEGEGAGGVTVDQADFEIPGMAATDQVIAAILGTWESAAENGYRLRSSGVTWTDRTDTAALRNALAERKIENVVLVSAFMAAAALAQAVGSATNCARTALLFVEPTTATLAVVDTSDGSIADVRRRSLPDGGDAMLAELAAMVESAESLHARLDAVFLVGSGVDIPSIKPALEAATSLAVTVPEEPEMALARGAALASANEQLGAPSTVAMPYVRDPGRELAYSAEATNETDGYREYAADRGGRRSRKVLTIFSAAAIFVVGAVALTLALAVGIRPHVDQRPDISKNVVAPVTQAAPPPKAPPSAPPPPAAPVSPPAPAPAAPNPAPSSNQPQQGPLPPPRDDDHWGRFRRRLGHGILGP